MTEGTLGNAAPADVVRGPVLLVGDDSETRQLLQTALGVGQIIVAAPNDAKQMLAMARGQAPDLIVVSMDGSACDAIALAQQLKADENTATIPLLAVTDRPTPGVEQEAQSAGFDAVLIKPTTATVLEGVACLLLERAALLRKRSRGSPGISGSVRRPSVETSHAATLRAPSASLPRCRYCGRSDKTELLRTTPSSETYRCGVCHRQWRRTPAR
jgi:CheY-like chemotaxis protein